MTPAESAASRIETIEKMLDLLEPWSHGRWAFAISKLSDLLNRLRALPHDPTASDVENIELEFLGLLFETPTFRDLELAAGSLPVIQSAAEYLDGLKLRERDGTITDDERRNLPELNRSLDSFQSDIRRYLQEFEAGMGDRDIDEAESSDGLP